MPAQGLDHINIRTTDVMASVRFYEDVLGLKYTAGPLVRGHQGHWLCDSSGNAIIHLREKSTDSPATGSIDHIALRADGQDEMVRRLEARGIEFKVAEGLLPGITQVFFIDPHGIPFEIQFSR